MMLPFLLLTDLLKAGEAVAPCLGSEPDEPGLPGAGDDVPRAGAGDSDLRIVILRSMRFSFSLINIQL